MKTDTSMHISGVFAVRKSCDQAEHCLRRVLRHDCQGILEASRLREVSAPQQNNMIAELLVQAPVVSENGFCSLASVCVWRVAFGL